MLPIPHFLLKVASVNDGQWVGFVRTPATRTVLATGLAALLVGSWAAICPAEPCRIELTVEASAAWRAAVQHLDALELTDRDCARIDVHPQTDGAALAFSTADGRRAVRRLASPDELRPTIDALVVGGPALPQPAAAASSASARSPAPEAIPPAAAELPSLAPHPLAPSHDRVELPRAVDSSAQDSGRLGVVLALEGGARGGADALLSPALQGSLSFVLRQWELGVLVGWESNYSDLSAERSENQESGALAIGIGVGTHQVLGRFAVSAGGRLAIAGASHYEITHAAPVESEGGSAAAPVPPPADPVRGPMEWRVGPYLGVAYPERSPVRLRASVAADFVAANFVTDVPLTPRWALAGTDRGSRNTLRRRGGYSANPVGPRPRRGRGAADSR